MTISVLRSPACTLHALFLASFAAAACAPAPRVIPAAPLVAAQAAATSTTRIAPAEMLPFGVRVAGHGPAMILIPGLGSSADVWNTTVAHEQDHFTCHVIELPGFAGRPRISAPILITVRDALAGYLRDHQLDHPVVVGHSLGGFLALDLARVYPDLVGKLVIVDSLPFLPAAFDPAATAESTRAAAEGLRTRAVSSGEAAFEKMERGMLATMITDPARQEVALGWVMRSDRTAVGDAIVEMMTTDLRPALDAIVAPTLVIEATRGLGVDPRVIERTYAGQYRELHGAKLVAADARHFVMFDDPAFLFAQMDAFLR